MMSTAAPVSKGLECSIVARPVISRVDGENGQLIYRGSEIGDLPRHVEETGLRTQTSGLL